MPRAKALNASRRTPISYKNIRTTKDYQEFLKRMYVGAKRKVDVLTAPPVQVLAVDGDQPPTSAQYANAIGSLYTMAYTLKMGLKFEKLPRPKGWFDYVVGALETQWWSTRGNIVDVHDASAVRWKAYLMVPSFIGKSLLDAARAQAKEKRPELPLDTVKLETVDEGSVAQILHVGPYDAEEPTIAELRKYLDEHGLKEAGHHHEIYLSDPRRTSPAKLRTVIRVPYRA